MIGVSDFGVAGGAHDGGDSAILAVKRQSKHISGGDDRVPDVVEAGFDGGVGVDAAEGRAVEFRSGHLALPDLGGNRFHHGSGGFHGVEDRGRDRGDERRVGAAGDLVWAPDAGAVGAGMGVRAGDDEAVAVKPLGLQGVLGITHPIFEDADDIHAYQRDIFAVERKNDRGRRNRIVYILRRTRGLISGDPDGIEVPVAIGVVVGFSVAAAASARRVGHAAVELAVAVQVEVGLSDGGRDVHLRYAYVELVVVPQDDAEGRRRVLFRVGTGQKHCEQHRVLGLAAG